MSDIPELSFQQAMQRKIDQFTAEIRQEVERHLDFLRQGITVAEATADIPEPNLRQAVTTSLLYAHACSLAEGLHSMGLLTRPQADELYRYMSQGLMPRGQTQIEPAPTLAPTFVEVAVRDTNGEEKIYPLPLVPRVGDTLVLEPDAPGRPLGEAMRQVEEVVLLARDVVSSPRRSYVRVFLAEIEEG